MNTRPYILSIAGYDPSAGAGVLADVKTFEQHKTMGLAVTTCLTYQTEDSFFGIEWHTKEQVLNQLLPLIEKYHIKYFKIGLIKLELLEEVLSVLSEDAVIIWDPVLSATAGFNFNHLEENKINSALKKITLITPNLEEYKKLGLEHNKGANILLKGGHALDHKNDQLILSSGLTFSIEGQPFKKAFKKHGTGCVLSSSIAANLALGNSLQSSCKLAKAYVEDLLQSNDSLLGYHQN